MVFFYHDLPSSPPSPTVPMTLGRVRRRDRCERISGIALVGTEIVELTGFSGDQPTAPAGRVRPGKFRKAQVGVNP
jgi:hypothetical protein